MLRPEDQRGKGVCRHGASVGHARQCPEHVRHRVPLRGPRLTTAVDAAIPPLGARHAHHELRDTPIIDKAILVLMGNNHAVMDRIRAG